MANWYTNNVTGNDTTGDGSIGNPYKTIAKVYTVCANDDVIYVAGSGSTLLPGTATQSTNEICNTTNDLSAIVAVGDVIGITDDMTGKTFWSSVRSITSTTIGFSTNMIPFRNRTLTLERVDTTHYSTSAANTTLENITTTTKQGITISGGWDPTYTSQIGYTWMVYRNSTGASSGSGLGYSSSSPAWNIKLERFGWANIANPMGTLYSDNNSTTTIIGDLTVSNTSTSGYIRGTVDTQNYPVFTSFDSNGFGRISSNFDLGNGDPACIFSEFRSCQLTRSLSASTASGYLYVQVWEAVLGNYFSNYPTNSNAILGSLTKTVIDQLNIYKLHNDGAIGDAGCALNGYSTASFPGNHRIKGLDLFGTGIRLGLGSTSSSTANLFDIDLGSKNLMDIPWTNSGSTVNWYDNGLIKGQGMIKAADGTAILKGFQLYQTDSTVFDTGTNSLKWNRKQNITVSYPETSGVDTIVIGDFIAEASRTVRVRMKLDAAHTAGLIQFQFVSLENGQIVSMDPGIGYFGTNWTNYDMTIDLLDAEFARIANRHVQLTLQVNGNALNSGITAAWIDSVELI